MISVDDLSKFNQIFNVEFSFLQSLLQSQDSLVSSNVSLESQDVDDNSSAKLSMPFNKLDANFGKLTGNSPCCSNSFVCSDEQISPYTYGSAYVSSKMPRDEAPSNLQIESFGAHSEWNMGDISLIPLPPANSNSVSSVTKTVEKQTTTMNVPPLEFSSPYESKTFSLSDIPMPEDLQPVSKFWTTLPVDTNIQEATSFPPNLSVPPPCFKNKKLPGPTVPAASTGTSPELQSAKPGAKSLINSNGTRFSQEHECKTRQRRNSSPRKQLWSIWVDNSSIINSYPKRKELVSPNSSFLTPAKRIPCRPSSVNEDLLLVKENVTKNTYHSSPQLLNACKSPSTPCSLLNFQDQHIPRSTNERVKVINRMMKN